MTIRPLLKGFLALAFFAMSALHAAPLDTDKVVLRIVAQTAGMRPEAVRPELAFSRQAVPMDELDLVETIMAIEDALGIAIPDEALGAVNKRKEIVAIADKLTVRRLQESAGTIYRRKFVSAPRASGKTAAAVPGLR